MNSLELINEEIELEKDYLKSKDIYGLKSKRFNEKRLQTLLQIKDELEIMELIKNGWSSMETTLAGDQIMRFQNLKIDDWLKLWNRLEEQIELIKSIR